MPTRKRPRTAAHAPTVAPGDSVAGAGGLPAPLPTPDPAPPAGPTASELLAATADPDADPIELRHLLDATRQEMEAMRRRLEGRIEELERALVAGAPTRCPICGGRPLPPPADETESI
ncbi:MAG TPA: hypothetical protein VG389_18705 [Myxococcota bacterium]|jgi:hypothetical protein|nr:hypothetical protein [Myxococcota bacterium]